MPHVSVIIVNFNSGNLLSRSLDSLAKQTRLADRIVVVDNNSSDNSLDNLPHLSCLDIIKSPVNLGFAKANNLAISQIYDSDYVVLLNPDAFADPYWLENLLRIAEINPQHYFFASKMVDEQKRGYYDGAGDIYHISGRPRRRHYRRLISEINESTNTVFSPCGGAAMYRTSSFKELGGFDESFFCYMEDIDLGFRMQLQGYTGLYVDNAIVYHMGSAITGRQSDFSVYYGHRNLVWTYFKNMPISLLVLLFPYHLLLNFLSIVYFVRQGKSRVIFRAKKDALLGLPQILKKRRKIQKSRKVTGRYIWTILDKKSSNFVFCHSSWLERIFSGHYFRQLLLFVKNNIKNTVFTPFLYFFYFSLSRSIIIFKQKLESSQNIQSINQMSVKRGQVLLSQTHANWLNVRGQKEAFPGADSPGIDLSVVTYNSEVWIASFFRSLLEQNYPLERINLFFVDNTSSDGTLKALESVCQQYHEQFASVSISSRENFGFGMGHDFAIGQGKSDYILVSNIDLIFSSNSIVEAVSMAKVDSNQVASWEFRQKPFEHPKYYDPITLETSWSSHACILLRRSAYENVGGYEPEIFMYGEDVELSYRLRRSGYILKYNPWAIVLHFSYQEVGEIKPLQFRGSALSNAYLRLAYGDLYDQVLIAPLQIAKLLIGANYDESRNDIAENFKKIWKNMSYFKSKNKQENGLEVNFPFRGFDYEMRRDGAFYECDVLELDGEDDSLPLVTIVTRTYKGRQNWLKECIVSVMNQTYSNIQHVIVEDGGSTMQPLMDQITRCYTDSDNPGYMHSYHALPKVGRSCAGNKGLELADGEWVMFLDDDDLLMPDHVETLILAVLKKHDFDAAYSLSWDVQTDVRMGSDEKQVAFNYLEKNFSTPPRYYQEFSLERLFEENYMPIQSILFKRQLFELYGGFDEEIDYLEDWLLWTKYAINHKFIYVPKTTSLFRTPYSLQELVKRKMAFDKGYDELIAKQQALRQSLT